MQMTSLEKEALDKTVELWNSLVALPVVHPDDINEFRLDIHRIQDKLMSRPMRRLMKTGG